MTLKVLVHHSVLVRTWTFPGLRFEMDSDKEDESDDDA